ncbi:MAG: 50S ribosomal protein L35 [Candidatus Moranbacteria bacterium]|nr:50S ribosomal protein L35 [Candidatus Moranbacteria bacterium]
MPKLKSKRAASKRFKVTAKGKVMRRRSKQNHFNSRQTSDKRREKRNDQTVYETEAKNIKQDILKN